MFPLSSTFHLKTLFLIWSSANLSLALHHPENKWILNLSEYWDLFYLEYLKFFLLDYQET